MKAPFFPVITYSIILHTLMSQEISPLAQKPKELLNEITAKVSQRAGWEAQPAMAIENSHVLKKMPEFIELQQLEKTTWPQMIDGIQTVAPSSISKAILFVSLQSLPADDYLQFVARAVGLAENNTIEKRFLYWALLPADKNVRGVIEFNFDKPVVRDVLKRVKVLYADDPNMIKYCDATLSGETKKSAVAYLNDNPSEPRPTENPGSLPDPDDAKRVGPLSRQQSRGEDPPKAPASAPVATISKETGAYVSRFYVWSALATAVLFSGVWLFLRLRKRRGAG